MIIRIYKNQKRTSRHIPDSRKITTAAKTEKPKLKIINQATENGNIQTMLNSNKKHRKYVSPNCKIIAIGDAVFRSNFESGNIQSVQKIAPATYEITLMKELNSDRVSAWFYFMVEGIKGQAKFIIKGFTKTSSLYNEGMKICSKEAQQNKWRRGGTKILYTQSYCDDEDARRTYQLHFCYFFKSSYPNGVQFAYCFPYTYSHLIKFISLSQSKLTIQSLDDYWKRVSAVQLFMRQNSIQKLVKSQEIDIKMTVRTMQKSDNVCSEFTFSKEKKFDTPPFSKQLRGIKIVESQPDSNRYNSSLKESVVDSKINFSQFNI